MFSDDPDDLKGHDAILKRGEQIQTEIRGILKTMLQVDRQISAVAMADGAYGALIEAL